MSQRDLPVWARVGTALLVLVGSWFATRSDLILRWVGDAVLPVTAGIIAISVLLGMRLPLDLWPSQPQRPRFSVLAAVAVSLVFGGMILISGPVGAASEFLDSAGPGAQLAVVAGGVGWALGWGHTQQSPFSRWYGLALALGLLPIAAGVLWLVIRDGGVPSFEVSVLLRETAFFLTVGTCAALLTQELAFRRLLIGQSGDAGLLAVVLSAAIFGVWHAVAPAEQGELSRAVITATVEGLVLGSVYLLSRSLLVPALLHGVSVGVSRGLQFSAGPEVSLGDRMWVAETVTATAVALVLGIIVARRSGLFGTLQLRPAVDAAGD